MTLNTSPSKVSVFGAGNAGVTAAYHFAKLGHDVALYGDEGFDQQIHAISAEGGINALAEFAGAPMAFAGFEHVSLLTTEIQQAVEFADVLILPVPSFAQLTLFSKMLPYLKDGQTIVLMPGNYGSLVLNEHKNQSRYAELDITFVDAISIPWATRITGDAQIAIMGIKNYLPVAALPASRTNEAIEKLNQIFPIPLTALDNVIAAGLENINFGGHPLMTMLNIGLLENRPGEFNYYTDCCSTATAAACEVLDKERLAVGEALGLNLKSELQAMNDLYDMNATSVYEVNRTSSTHGNVNSAPDSSKSRYISEDAPYLLTPCYELATLVGIDVPIVSSVLHITSAMNGENYFKTGRTLADMGLANLNLEQIMHRVS